MAADKTGKRNSAQTPSGFEVGPPEQTALERLPLDIPSKAASFDTIYRDAGIPPARLGYNILKLAEMTESPHMARLTPEALRNALLMALEAAGVDINALIADAISRQRALNQYEQTLLSELREFETEKAKEASQTQMELDWLMAQCRSRMQANAREVAREQAAFQAWQEARRIESYRIVTAATLLVPPDSASGGDSLAALLDCAALCSK